MSFGFSALGEVGNVQVDSAYKNLVLIKSGSVTLSNGNVEFASSSSDPRVLVTCAGIDPVIALKTSHGTRTYRVPKGGGNYEFHILGDPGHFVQYFIFDEPPQGAATFGMRVFSSEGEKVFDSAHRPLRVLGQYRGNASPWPFPGSISYTEHRFSFQHGNLAVVTCQQAARLVVETYEMMGSYFYESFINSSRSFIDGSDVVVVNAQEVAFPGGSRGGEMFRRDLWEILVVDVSGYPSNYSAS